MAKAFLIKHGIHDANGVPILAEPTRAANVDEAPNASQDAEVKNRKRMGVKGSKNQVSADEHGGENVTACPVLSMDPISTQHESRCGSA